MRILILETRGQLEGGARVFLAAGRALAERGYDVSFACPASAAISSHVRAAGLETVDIAKGASFRSRARVLKEAFQDRYVEVVFVEGESNDLAASLATRMAGRGSVVRRFAAGERPQRTWRTGLARRLAPATYLLSAVRAETLAPLRSAAQVTGELGIEMPAPPAEHSGTDAGASSVLQLACVASHDALAGALNVLRAVALLAERHPRVRLTISGSAARHDDLRLYAAALRLARLVHFASGDSDGLRSAELAWVVGDGDEAALGCLNVMARGIPVLARHTDVTAHFITPQVHGILFPALDPPSMAATVSTFTVEPDRRARIGAAARQRVERDFNERALSSGFEQATRTAREHGRELTREHARGIA